MGIYGKEVEEEIFENENVVLSAKRVGYKQRNIFLNLWNGFQVFFFLELPIVTTEPYFKAFWKYSAI